MPRERYKSPLLDICNLRDGQMRVHRHVHNGAWYDRDGLKIGWGDLTKVDIFHIAKTIPADQTIYIVGEHDSYRNAPPEGLTLDMVKDLARFIITSGSVTATKRWLSRLQGAKSYSTLEEYDQDLEPRLTPRNVTEIK